uniref:Uncharacterized protein n=1 Tax=Cyclopterus lumpus TaxID=8103 RepID=A0A8C2ZJI9_CYCLU
MDKRPGPFPSYLSCPSVIVNIPFLHGWTSFLFFVFHCFKYESNMRLELLVKRNKHVAAPEANSFTVQRAARWPLYEQNYICFLKAPRESNRGGIPLPAWTEVQ